MKHNFWNLIACLKNGAIAKKPIVLHINKKFSKELLTLLWEEGYILGFSENKTDKNKINIFLKYDSKKRSSIKNISPISKPGKRVYCSVKNFWKLSSCNKLIIISTTKGLKSLEFCKKNNLGGELLLTIT